jgi:glutathionyl-hydroquinone reductase
VVATDAAAFLQVLKADWRLFTTLIRFDAVYHAHFKCNRTRIADFSELWGYTRTLYQILGIAGTVHLDQIKMHYYGSHKMINPTGIIRKGPQINLVGADKTPPGMTRLLGADFHL